MTQEKLNEVLERHGKWLRGERGGERADLSHDDLRGVSLLGADLRSADLYGTDLCFVNLRSADLRDARLRFVNLRGADLHGADLRNANLRDANLHGADLRNANLRDADLRGANLRGANLTHAAYTGTVLNLQCPEEGSFIAWKKLSYDAIAKLLIPEDAKRSSATTRKCRASKATVLAIYDKNGEPIDRGYSRHNDAFIYQVGEHVYPDKWDEDRWNECSNGIHFFIARKEAEEY